MTLCRSEYMRLARNMHRLGLDRATIVENYQTLTEHRLDGCFLKTEAYQPTGIALGCPLPSRETRILLNASRMVDAWLRKHTSSNQAEMLSFVPSESYHITILNRTHYEVSPTYILLTDNEQVEIARFVSSLELGFISVITCGLLLTRSGRLFVRCLPVDDRILHLRQKLMDSFPQLRIKAPIMIHMKLAHLAIPLNDEQLLAFFAWMRRLDQYVSMRLDFHDLHTPTGRISL